jgi:hypothetical protein
MTFERYRAVLFNAQQGHQVMQALWTHIKPYLLAEHRLHIEVRADTRSLAQNRLLWQRLTDISEQVDWCGTKPSQDDWKDILSASRKKQRASPGIDGGFVIHGERTSQMTVAEMTELLELAEAFGTQRGVKFKEHQE